MRGLVAVLLAAAAVFAGSAAGAPTLLGARDAKLKPSGVRIRLVVAKTTRHGRVTVLLTLYRRIGVLGYRRVKQVVVAKGLKKSGRLKRLAVKRAGRNVAAVRVTWKLSRHRKHIYRWRATAARLRRG